MSLAGEPFISFGIVHVTTAAVTLCVAVFVPLMISRYATPNQQHWLRFALAGVVVFQLGINIWVGAGLFDLPLVQQLPLHLCGASLLISLLFLLSESYRAYEVAYFWAMAGGMAAIAMPDLEYTFPHPFFILFFTGHGLEIASVMYGTFVMRFRPQLASLGRALVATAAYALCIAPVNYWFETNFLYLRHKPERPSILDLMGPWPWYILGLVCLSIMLAVICYLPFALRWAGASRAR